MDIKPIGIIHSPFTSAKAVPIQPVYAGGVEGTVEVFPEFAEALADLEGFERVWLLYWFDRTSGFKSVIKPFRDDRVHGLFATRAPARPNPIGLSSVRLLSVEGNTLHVGDIDILDNTPLLDIKPYAKRFDCFGTTRDGWLDEERKATTKSDGRFYGDEKG
mgnify:CR=1 FL=1